MTLALVAAIKLALSGLVAGWVANRNANTIDDAREQGLELATAVTEFRTNLAAADATAAATLIAGGLESTDSRAQYDTDLLQASRALTDAGLVARAEDRDDIRAMANGTRHLRRPGRDVPGPTHASGTRSGRPTRTRPATWPTTTSCPGPSACAARASDGWPRRPTRSAARSP